MRFFDAWVIDGFLLCGAIWTLNGTAWMSDFSRGRSRILWTDSLGEMGASWISISCSQCFRVRFLKFSWSVKYVIEFNLY